MSSEEQHRREGEPDREPSGETPPGEEPHENEPRASEAGVGEARENETIDAEEDGDESSSEGIRREPSDHDWIDTSRPEYEDSIEAESPEDVEVVPELTPEDALEDGPEADPEDEVEIAHEEVLALAAELEDARRERDEYLDNMRRMKAEMENSRKRLERDRARLAQLASERLVRELLPVLDNLERALEVEGDVREGVRATRDQLLAALAREGLEPVLSDGEGFDPAVHEAVMGQPSEEHEEDTVIQTLERGYTFNGRAIRPAKVIVAKQA